MKEAVLRQISEKYLLPFFSGAYLEVGAPNSSPKEKMVSYAGPCSIAFKVDASDPYRLVMTRAQAFTDSTSNEVPEIRVVQAFVSVLSSMKGMLDGEFREDLLVTVQRRVVARALMDGATWEAPLLAGIDQLSKWGARLYEGSPIAAAIGFRSMTKSGGGIPLSEIADQDFGAVLSNGHDSILEFDYKQSFIGHQVLGSGSNPPSFCPFRQVGVAEWTTAHEARIAMTLNRLGEILIFRNQKLLFARRSGRWHFLTHGPVIKQMNIPRNLALRTAIYETCLDASFARTGACIGVVQVGNGEKLNQLVDGKDMLFPRASVKSRTLATIVGSKKFNELDRRLRQEIAAIDGAIVLSHRGTMLAAGAILKIGGGSTGGGRLAAAQALSELGLGIKISQDGGISGYRAGSLEPKFRVM